MRWPQKCSGQSREGGVGNSLAEVERVVGVDAHKDSFSYVVLRTREGGIESRGHLPNNEEGYKQLLGMFAEKAMGSGLVFAIENARGYGLGLSWYLLNQQHLVYDIPATQVAALRRKRNRAKNDLEDAQQAAKVLLDESFWLQHSALNLSTIALQIQSLERTRESLVKQQVAIGQQLHALATQPFAVTEVKQSLEAVQITLQQQIKALEKALANLLQPYSALLLADGIGLIMAGVLVGEVQDPHRFRSEAAFASYAGVAPKDHSSGRSQRVKVNPGGNRRLNRAIELITWSRLRGHQPTRDYHQRKRKEGMAARQATRATKRQVCRDVFRTLCQVLT